jgi:hypothetical protein
MLWTSTTTLERFILQTAAFYFKEGTPFVLMMSVSGFFPFKLQALLTFRRLFFSMTAKIIINMKSTNYCFHYFSFNPEHAESHISWYPFGQEIIHMHNNESEL